MSSLLDAIISSDQANAETNGRSTQERQKQAERRRLQQSSSQPPSSSRPRAPPSDSQGPQSDIDAYPDDEQIAVQAALRRRRAGGPRPDVPRVIDSIGEAVHRRFEEFLETYV